jgi:hypothetical protein
MSTVVPPKGHRHTRSATIPSATSSSQNPQNPHHLNLQTYAQNSQSEMNNPLHPTTPPKTPRRDDQYQPQSQNKTNSAAPENGYRQKPRNKNRPKNVMTSPTVTRNNRNTPPLTNAQSAGMSSSAKPINTPSTAAYAGPTFHASPAPSALPIPSFYSKSVPESPGVKGLKGLKTLKDASSSGESPPPPAPTFSNYQFQREESPLDFFFKADREEKARARSANSTHATGGPFQPPSESPRTSQTPPAPNSQNRARQAHANRISASGMFSMELDGPSSPGTPYGPAFSTPYSERINAARPATVATRSLEQTSQNSQQSIDRSEALKAYLFSGQSLPAPAAPPVTPQSAPGSVPPVTPTTSIVYRNTSAVAGGPKSTVFPPRSQQHSYSFAHDNNAPRTSGRASGLRQEVTPTRTPAKTPDRRSNYANSPTPSRMYGNSSSSHADDFISNFTSHAASPIATSSNDISSANRSADLQGMEDSLRKILKLDSAGSSGATESGIGSTHMAAVSVPNYVGGRPSPLNGMHNGVMGS